LLALAISLASAASWGLSDFLGGLQSRRLPVLAVLAVSQPAGLLFIALLLPLFGADPIPAQKLAIAFAAGAASLGGLGAFYASRRSPRSAWSCRSRSVSPRVRSRV
jgi:hypothetical protein